MGDFKVIEGKVATLNDGVQEIAIDDYLEIYVNGRHYTTIVVNPAHLEETIIGILAGDGIVKSINEIEELVFIERRVDALLKRRDVTLPRLIHDDCASIIESSEFTLIKSDLKISWDLLRNVYLDFNKRTISLTRGLAMHTSAVYDLDNREIVIAHDVSRHTSIAKLIGLALVHGVKLDNSIALTTGRASSDMVWRLARVGVPILVSTRGPLASGVRASRTTGLTLVTYSRRGSNPGFRVVNGKQRIV